MPEKVKAYAKRQWILLFAQRIVGVISVLNTFFLGPPADPQAVLALTGRTWEARLRRHS